MFTGIIADIGQIFAVVPLANNADAGVRLQVQTVALDMSDVALGDSIAINGACMTVVAMDAAAKSFAVDVSRESLNKTAGLDALGHVNLEKAMRLSDRLGGHLVSGHVDDVARIESLAAVGESYELVFSVAAQWQRFLADKGSVTLNGTSLTVNRVWTQDGRVFGTINLIPHTMAHTVFQYLSAGDSINFEVDLLARYVAQLMVKTD
jgi:riboflavin synthase